MSKALWSMTAVMKFVKSRASPILILETSEHRSSPIASHTDEGMYALLAALHFCPWYSNEPLRRATNRPRWSQSGWATTKSLPPVSPTILG